MEEMTVWTEPKNALMFALKLEHYCDSKFLEVVRNGTIEEKEQLIRRYEDVQTYYGNFHSRNKHPKIKRLQKAIKKMEK